MATRRPLVFMNGMERVLPAGDTHDAFNPGEVAFGWWDFLNTLTGTPFVTSLSGGTVSSSTASGRVGGVVLSTGTGVSNYACFLTSRSFIPGSGELEFTAVWEGGSSPASGDTGWNTFIGFFDNQIISSNSTGRAGFRIWSGNSTTKWCALTQNGANVSVTATSVNIATNSRQVLRGVINADGTSASFYIDGNLVHTETTNLPTVAMGLGIFVDKSSSGTSGNTYTATLDGLGYKQRFTNKRF